jgi:hypothetical protein
VSLTLLKKQGSNLAKSTALQGWSLASTATKAGAFAEPKNKQRFKTL